MPGAMAKGTVVMRLERYYDDNHHLLMQSTAATMTTLQPAIALLQGHVWNQRGWGAVRAEIGTLKDPGSPWGFPMGPTRLCGKDACPPMAPLHRLLMPTLYICLK